jgi:uncharacterized membrane-anchored protein YhcB (DUF1043 family)
MEIESTSILISVVSLITGIFIGIQVVKFFSNELINKLEHSLEDQLEVNQNFLNKATERMIASINIKLDFIEQINVVLQKTKMHLLENSQKIEQLNQICHKRSELEAEIVKLKKIIHRLERKR